MAILNQHIDSVIAVLGIKTPAMMRVGVLASLKTGLKKMIATPVVVDPTMAIPSGATVRRTQKFCELCQHTRLSGLTHDEPADPYDYERGNTVLARVSRLLKKQGKLSHGELERARGCHGRPEYQAREAIDALPPWLLNRGCFDTQDGDNAVNMLVQYCHDTYPDPETDSETDSDTDAEYAADLADAAYFFLSEFNALIQRMVPDTVDDVRGDTACVFKKTRWLLYSASSGSSSRSSSRSSIDGVDDLPHRIPLQQNGVPLEQRYRYLFFPYQSLEGRQRWDGYRC